MCTVLSLRIIIRQVILNQDNLLLFTGNRIYHPKSLLQIIHRNHFVLRKSGFQKPILNRLCLLLSDKHGIIALVGGINAHFLIFIILLFIMFRSDKETPEETPKAPETETGTEDGTQTPIYQPGAYRSAIYLEDETVEWCETILSRSPMAIRMIKRALNAELDGQRGMMEFAGDATLMYYLMAEAQEGKNAFLEKRAPDFDQFPKFP